MAMATCPRDLCSLLLGAGGAGGADEQAARVKHTRKVAASCFARNVRFRFLKSLSSLSQYFAGAA
jgi:hypothetical protein